MLKRANERFNASNINQTITHSDMDPKNVMWNNDNPVIIDWESASLDNPHRELIEIALSWSGFLSNNFSEEKFKAILEEYTKVMLFEHNRYITICGNLVGRFGWLKYNLERSLGIISNDPEEIKLAEIEVTKTINEINRYLDLIGTMDNIFMDLTKEESTSYDQIIERIIDRTPILKGLNYELINSGFTNTIYRVGDYIVRICTSNSNEKRFKKEIAFYQTNNNNTNIPTLYVGDTTKSVVPYYYEVINRINGNTLYEVWYKISDDERKQIVLNIISILKSIHKRKEEETNFKDFIKEKLTSLLRDCNINDDIYNSLLILCDKYFADNNMYQIHGDLHFDNFIYDKNKLTLLDFERTMTAPLDYEFRILNRYNSMPWLWASGETDMLTVESDYQDLMSMIIDNYSELKSIPYLIERLTIYEIIDLLTNYKNTKDEEALKNAKAKVRLLVK
jgi:aminoglycoside phosphotransferase (APT) family kinase protein